MTAFEFVGASVQDPDNRSAATSRLVNCYRERVDGRTSFVLKSVPAMTAFVDLNWVYLRAMRQIGDFVYAAAGGRVYRVSKNGSVLLIGDIADDIDTTFSSNNGVVAITAAGRYFTIDGTTINEPVAGAFTSVGSVAFAGQRTILSERGGRRFQWSAVADAATLGGDFSTTESRDDDNMRVFALGSQVWFLKENSIERWYLSGDAAFLAPVPGGTIDTGLKAFGLVCEVPNGLFFIGSNGTIFLASEGGTQPVSTVAVETAIKQGRPTACFYYEDEGHKFCAIRFEDRPAWVFDLSLGEWHERAEGYALGPWSAIASVKAWDDFYVGALTGEIYRLARVGEDATGPLVRRAVGKTVRTGKPFRVAMVEFYANVGNSALGRESALVLDAGDGRPLDAGDGGALVISFIVPAPRAAKMMLRVSPDYGNTWSDAYDLSLGNQGEFWTRVVQRALGQFNSVTPEVTVTDPADILIDAVAELGLV